MAALTFAHQVLGIVDMADHAARESQQRRQLRFTLLTNSENVLRQQICQMIRTNLEDIGVVAETPAAQVVDFGCGTGRLAIGMARAGFRPPRPVTFARRILRSSRRRIGGISRSAY